MVQIKAVYKCRRFSARDDPMLGILLQLYASGEVDLPSMCYEKLHGFFYPGSQGILASQEQQ